MDWLASFGAVLTPSFISLMVAAGIGLIIGLEREFNTHDQPSHAAGIRTFILVAIAGDITGWLSVKFNPVVLVVMLAGFVLLISVSYFVQTQKGKMGLTTPMASLLTFLLGIAVSGGYMQESLAVVVVMTTVLSLKTQLHGFIAKITEEELIAFVKFIVMALLLLPLLPNEQFGPEHLLNLRDLGYIVVLVLSISFAGYLLLKFGSPHKGILLTAIIGGLFSSTMIAWVFSAKSRDRKDLAATYGSGIVLASTIMFIRVFIWVSIFAFPVAKELFLPLCLMLLASLAPTWQVLRKRGEGDGTPPLEPGNPLDIKNAIFFVFLYIGITIFMWASRNWLNQTMTYISGAIAGVADIDAITISTAKWAAAPGGTAREAATIILLAVMSNSLFKWLVSVFNGTRELRQPVSLGFGLVMMAGVSWLVYWLVF